MTAPSDALACGPPGGVGVVLRSFASSLGSKADRRLRGLAMAAGVLGRSREGEKPRMAAAGGRWRDEEDFLLVPADGGVAARYRCLMGAQSSARSTGLPDGGGTSSSARSSRTWSEESGARDAKTSFNVRAT
jgi:hypothetical protein